MIPFLLHSSEKVELCVFLGAKKKSIEIHIFEPQKVQSRLYRADATSRYDVRESCATNLSCCFFWGGCLGGMQGSSAYFVWALAPYYKKKGSYIFLYILSICVQFHFYFWIFVYFIYTHESPTRHFCFRYLRLVYELPSFNEGFSIISTEAPFLWYLLTSRIHTQ